MGNEVSNTKIENQMRLIRVKTTDRNGKEKIIDILTNRFDLPAYMIGQLYKNRPAEYLLNIEVKILIVN